jgi:hypothetical protein
MKCRAVSPPLSSMAQMIDMSAIKVFMSSFIALVVALNHGHLPLGHIRHTCLALHPLWLSRLVLLTWLSKLEWARTGVGRQDKGMKCQNGWKMEKWASPPVKSYVEPCAGAPRTDPMSRARHGSVGQSAGPCLVLVFYWGHRRERISWPAPQ